MKGEAGRRSKEAVVRKESKRAAMHRGSGWNVQGWSANRVDGAQMVVHSPNDEHKQTGSRAAQRALGESHTRPAGIIDVASVCELSNLATIEPGDSNCIVSSPIITFVIVASEKQRCLFMGFLPE